MNKLIRIRLNEQRYEIADLPTHYRNLGGRALTSGIVAAEVPPKADPLGEQNKLVIAAGILAGTALPNNGRLSIGSKSPLTGTIKEANAGGSAAQKMARLGIQAIVLEGRASELVNIKIDKEGVTFAAADTTKLAVHSDTIAKGRDQFGDSISMITIGPAGEMGLRAACIMVTSPDFFPRAAARGGLGAVMGAKNVKAVIIDDQGSSPPEVKDKEAFKASVKAFTEGITAHPLAQGFKLFGTPVLVNMINEMGAFPTKNFSQGRFSGAEKISGERMAELMKQRPNAKSGHRCMSGCVMNCSNVFTDEAGQVVVAGLEYETLALMGANCMIDDLDMIARLNALCNELGLDTMDVGGALAVAMEAGLIPWGDGPKAIQMVQEIAEGTANGIMIGNGCKHAGDKLGVTRIPHVKGQCLAGYDPRVLKGTGATYATSPMGADHTCGNALPSPANPAYNPSAAEGQAPVSQFLQRYCAAIDSLGLCLFASLPALDMPELQKHLVNGASAFLGKPLPEDYLMQLGDAVLKSERGFNLSAGFGNDDDRLPGYFKTEALPDGGVFDVSDTDLDTIHQ